MAQHPNKEPDLPRFHKRAFAHNYHAPFIYHIILQKNEGIDCFGMVGGDARISPGNYGCAHIERTLLGNIIAKEITTLQYRFPILQIYQFMVIPDHVHILLRVKEWSEFHLDYYIESLISAIGESYRTASNNNLSGKEIFQAGYCDKPLLLKRNLDTLFKYIRENPHRLAMRQQFPHFFRMSRRLNFGGKSYEAYGNLFLLRNPDKDAIRLSRKLSPEEVKQKRNQWLVDASKGTVLVSPFISKAEKDIRSKAESLSARIILITHEAFGERYKPAAHDFNLCSRGLLLIISLGLPSNTPLTRELCMQMNSLAATLATSSL